MRRETTDTESALRYLREEGLTDDVTCAECHGANVIETLDRVVSNLQGSINGLRDDIRRGLA